MYKLSDNKGRLLVVRPDSTMPIARVVATRLRDAELPLKLCYNQTVYRNESVLKGRSDETVQAGIELIGSEMKMADLEVISAAVDALNAFGLEFSLELGHIGVFKALVERLDADDKDKDYIRKLIENKNFPALNDFLDTFGNNSITAALKKLPEEIAFRKKLGFVVPIRYWMADEKYNQDVRDKFQSDIADKFFKKDEIWAIYEEYIGGNSDLWRKVWTIYTFLVWYEEYFVKR